MNASAENDWTMNHSVISL